MEFGATGGDRMMVDTTCGRAHVWTRLGLARTYPLRSVLPRRDRATPGAARLTVLEIEEPGCAAATGGTGRRRSAASDVSARRAAPLCR
jgi:hypothetical protein